MRLPCKEVTASGQVVRCRSNDKGKYVVAVKFDPLPLDVDRDIFAFVLATQRLLIRRGLL